MSKAIKPRKARQSIPITLQADHLVVNCEDIGKKVLCEYCSHQFANKSSATRHINRGQCTAYKIKEAAEQAAIKVAKEMSQEFIAKYDQQEAAFDQKLSAEVNKQIANIAGSTNNLNVMCLGSQDNLLDILTQKVGLPEALSLIKQSAIGSVGGDCFLLESIYLPIGKRPAIMYANKSKTKYIYFNEKNQRVVEGNVTELAKKLAIILQRSYLKGMSAMPTDICGNLREGHLPSTSLPKANEGEMQTWNRHVHQLNEIKNQKIILKSMKIPFEGDVPY